MSLDKIQQTVLEVLKEVQTLSGRTWSGLPLTANPFNELDGFDSLCSVEATVMLEEKLGHGVLNAKAFSLFVSEDGKRALTLLETSQLIQKLIAEKGGST